VKPLAVSLGDPAGVGPELIVEAWARREAERLPAFVAVGGFNTLVAAAERRGLDIPIAKIETFDDLARGFADALPVSASADTGYRPGEPTNRGADVSLRWLEGARVLAQSGLASGVVTGPISKDQAAKAGFRFPGQTEYFAAVLKCSAEDAVMMLAGPNLRTVPMTVHCALADVPRQLSIELIVHKGRPVAHALHQDFGIAKPRLAICGLNPHAGENGRMGREEIEIIAPAIAALREEGIDATGPHPADTLFAPRKRGTYDVAIAMYHDQALVPLKTLDFDHGVNVTLGLPIVRTSPDHGTAFDIAGKGIADPSAMIAAIRMAGEIAARRARA